MYHSIVCFDRYGDICHLVYKECEVRRFFLVCVIMAVSLGLLFSGEQPPTDAEVKVALQSVLVAAAATMAARNFSPPLDFSESQYISDSSMTSFLLRMEQADIGYLREQVLAQPAPAPRQMGFLEALLKNVLQVMPDHERLMAYLVPQALMPKEVQFSGHVEATRLAAPYPFRYEGSGALLVSGSRFSTSFSLEFSFVVPLEGPGTMAIIPVTVQAGGKDFLHVAEGLFPAPLLPDGRRFVL